MIITVFGLGFVGLTTSLGFASKGHKVYGIDVDKNRIKQLNNAELPFYEPGLDLALKENINKSFIITYDIDNAIRESDVVYYCVGTPYGENGEANLDYVYQTIDSTLNCIDDDKYRVLVTKSTIPPTTTQEKLVPYIEAKGFKIGENIGIANNPEFLREGHCWDDFINSDRIVLGVADKKSGDILKKVYESFDCPIFTVSLNTGEYIKYLSNTLLATLISFSNEMSIIGENIGNIDISTAFRILHMDKRFNDCDIKNYIYPGCGYGGYCLPKDTNAIYQTSKTSGYTPRILENVIRTNDSMHKFITDKITKNLSKEDTIGVLGLSFKNGSDDVRDTPAAKIIGELILRDYTKIIAYDPLAIDEFKKYYNFNINYGTKEDVIKSSDVLVILTAWDEFKTLSDETDKKIIDCRYMI